MAFNEDTRVKIPAILTLTRLGYGYLSLKDRTDIDPQTNIFKDIFFDSLRKLNPNTADEELQKFFLKIQTMLDYEDLGKAFYELLTSGAGIKLIDWEKPLRNTLNVCTELTCGNKDEDSFRPDITLLINGMPLAFIEVKKPNNREGIIAERTRINDRFKNRKFRRFINISQILLFSNNMEYEQDDTDPIQGAFYAASSKGKAFFNQFKEEKDNKARLFGMLKDENDHIENEVLKDNNYATMKYSKEFETNKRPDSPTNRAIVSLFAPERIFELLRYGFAYVEYDDEDGLHHLEKHIMRYPQFFASKAIQSTLDSGKKRGIIWHTQGSGKTALAYFSVRWLTDYFAKKNTIPQFYFIVDRIDLRTQAGNEFNIRGLKVNSIESKEDFIKHLKRKATRSGNSGEQEITVLNIHKFSEDARATTQKDYDINTQRVYFIDEAHRSYSPAGSFLANLIQSDPNAIIISLTGTPLLDKGEKRIASTEIFGKYIHKYYYDQSISDGYTLRLIREEIESKYKLKLKEIFEKIQVPKGDTRIKQIYAHQNFCAPLLEYIAEDLRKSRIQHNNDTIGGMVVCHSSEQAEMLFGLFKKEYEGKATDAHIPNTAALILHNADDKATRKNYIKSFKNGKIDLLFVFNMLLTGFDAPRLKKLYLGRVIKEHNLLQTLTRVNRPYQGFRYGYVVDFADIKKEFDKTNRAYWKELQTDWGEDMDGYKNLFKSAEEIEQDIKEIKDKLWLFDTLNAEVFQQQISEIKEKKDLLNLRKALQLATELYNIIRLNGYEELLGKLDFNQFKRLLNEVENRIGIINQREALQNGEDITGLLNEALEDSIFVFKKTGESALDLAANGLKDLLRKTREAMGHNVDKKDPSWVSLKEELERLLRDKNWEEAEGADIEEGTKILTGIYGRIAELNRKDAQLLVK
ncbi:MAG: DEAD/DEAH box helicase family protein [Alphaproteobacteria bacterium]|nr:DEAD/DEAH box helicase family protein [Alphaproteobacteria bacterium]